MLVAPLKVQVRLQGSISVNNMKRASGPAFPGQMIEHTCPHIAAADDDDARMRFHAGSSDPLAICSRRVFFNILPFALRGMGASRKVTKSGTL